MAEDFEATDVAPLLSALSPPLHRIAADAARSPAVRHKALYAVHEMVAHLGEVKGQQQRQLRDAMAPALAPWLPDLAALLAADVSLQVRMQQQSCASSCS